MPPRAEDPRREQLLLVPVGNDASRIVRGEARRWFVFEDDDVETEKLTALSEIVQNAVNAHVRDDVSRGIDVTFTTEPPAVRVVDFARGFDWETVLASEPDPGSVSGRGLRIAVAFVPDLAIASGAEGTTVVLPFHGAGWSQAS